MDAHVWFLLFSFLCSPAECGFCLFGLFSSSCSELNWVGTKEEEEEEEEVGRLLCLFAKCSLK